MIRKLRRRIILLVLAGLLLASAGVVFAINYMNWQSLESQVSVVLDMLAENGGQRPGRQGAGKQETISRPAGSDPEGKQSQRGRSDDMMNAADLTAYYTITLDGSGAVIGWSSDRADIYSDADVKDMAKTIRDRGDSSGRVGTQFYRVTERDGQKLVIVADQRLEIQNAEGVLRLTVLVALIEDAALSLGAVWLIRRMVKPVDEAMEKQKQFVWDASHELKTPLAVISANAEALSGEMGDLKPLEYIRSEVERADHLIQSLLTLARMEKGTVSARRQRFDLSRAVLEVALPFESAVFEAGRRMDMNVPDGVEYTGDADMIKQLLVILLSNARKYSDEGGVITVSLETRGDRRILKVHNTGPAIPKEARERIFDRFYRVDSSHNREIPGNGLGLAIARSIVEAHKGKITVQSAEGEGTSFTVTL